MWDEKGRRREKARGRECKREEEREEGKEERGRGEAGYSKDSKKGLDSLIPGSLHAQTTESWVGPGNKARAFIKQLMAPIR